MILEDVFEKTDRVVTGAEVVSDDDSTLRSHCSSVSNGGKLNVGVCEQNFLADPTHRIKVTVKSVFC